MCSRYKVRGVRYERELANMLWESGFAVIRGCASGSGVKKRFVPDIVAIRNGRTLVIEVKYRSKGDVIVVNQDRLRSMLEFARRASGTAYVAVKFQGEEWRFIEITHDVLERGLRLRRDDVLRSGLTLSQIINRLLSKPITAYGSNGEPERDLKSSADHQEKS